MAYQCTCSQNSYTRTIKIVRFCPVPSRQSVVGRQINVKTVVCSEGTQNRLLWGVKRFCSVHSDVILEERRAF